MSIWFGNPSLDDVIRRQCYMTLHVGIEFTEMGDDFLRATMPVDERTKQPLGLLNGGASCVLAESLGSTAGSMCIDVREKSVVGIEINASHLRPARDGKVVGTARPRPTGPGKR